MVRALATGMSFGHQGTALTTGTSFGHQGTSYQGTSFAHQVGTLAAKWRALPTKRGALGTVQLPPLCFESLVMCKRVFEATYSNTFSYGEW